MQTKLSRPWTVVAILSALGLGVVAGRTIMPPWQNLEPAAQSAAAGGTSKRYKIPVSISQPMQGRADALVTIVEWCDVPDAVCNALQPVLQALLARYPDETRVVFRHYPRPELGSMPAHQFLRVAHEHGGKFWPALGLLLAHAGEAGPDDLERYAVQLALDWKAVKEALDKRTFAGVVTADRVFADMFDVQALPAIFVNGRPLPGAVSAAALDTLVRDELARGRALVGTGVAKADVYAELTKNGAWTKPKFAAVR